MHLEEGICVNRPLQSLPAEGEANLENEVTDCQYGRSNAFSSDAEVSETNYEFLTKVERYARF